MGAEKGLLGGYSPASPNTLSTGSTGKELAGGPEEGSGLLGGRGVGWPVPHPPSVLPPEPQSWSSLPPQAPERATTPTARALSTSARGTRCSAGSGAPRTRRGSASGPGPPRPASWARITCAKVGGPPQGQGHGQGPSRPQPAVALRLTAGRQAGRQGWSREGGVHVRTSSSSPHQLCRQTRASACHIQAGASAAPGCEGQTVLIHCWAPKGYGKDVERNHVKHWRLDHSKGLTDTSF